LGLVLGLGGWGVGVVVRGGGGGGGGHGEHIKTNIVQRVIIMSKSNVGWGLGFIITCFTAICIRVQDYDVMSLVHVRTYKR